MKKFLSLLAVIMALYSTNTQASLSASNSDSDGEEIEVILSPAVLAQEAEENEERALVLFEPAPDVPTTLGHAIGSRVRGFCAWIAPSLTAATEGWIPEGHTSLTSALLAKAIPKVAAVPTDEGRAALLGDVAVLALGHVPGGSALTSATAAAGQSLDPNARTLTGALGNLLSVGDIDLGNIGSVLGEGSFEEGDAE